MNILSFVLGTPSLRVWCIGFYLMISGVGHFGRTEYRYYTLSLMESFFF